MSARALEFLDRWIAEHLPKVSDQAAIADLVLELVDSARSAGIAPEEIYEEINSVFRLLSEAMERPRGGLAP
ncbi:DUF768 domain-containing protein [Mesorhizobium sp. AA23]|uniref:DUF768 domain-containing protein n=1 Tax=Mesorhizobium sp. AA23 TaxID=1854058 RepID=UPI000836D271|nr:DUF768 domain-containing protein [Mesorhizobium sp. AA23]